LREALVLAAHGTHRRGIEEGDAAARVQRQFGVGHGADSGGFRGVTRVLEVRDVGPLEGS
jgi:hypothetical protein